MNKLNNTMRRDWDERARRDAFYYIASWCDDWDEKSFFDSGEQDYARFVEPALSKFHFDPTGKAMAELGCGAGRMTRSFAQRFQSVYAVDISAEMQLRAKNYLSNLSNVHWVLTNGETLSGIADSSMDFVFSYLVLQHLPTKELVFSSVREMVRILRPDGILLFQYNGSDQPNMNWRGRALCRVLDSLAAAGLRPVSLWIARAAGINTGMLGKTWRGAHLATAEIAGALGSSVALSLLNPDTPMAWCCGRKQAVMQE
jgi:ubiquinone/menaquinone biosynthesis C-methylase UbiE